MRRRAKNASLSVHAIAGTEVVLLGMNLKPEAAESLLGFEIVRESNGRRRWLSGGRTFASAKPNEGRDSRTAPLQAFLWGDYEVDPDQTYAYSVTPKYGRPGALTSGKTVRVTITTESPRDQRHAVFFNRGVAGSQSYSRQFGTHRKWYKVEHNGRDEWREFVRPADIPGRKALAWLSRGLEEGLLEFIGEAKGAGHALRAAAYELSYVPVVQAFVDAVHRGVDVKIIHHAKRGKVSRLKQEKGATIHVEYAEASRPARTIKGKDVVEETTVDDICRTARATVRQVGVTEERCQAACDAMMIERTLTQIAHNKFIILLKDDKPLKVWTGSTNFTAGGIFGQSNVGHIVRDEEVAARYLEYWEKLATDPRPDAAPGQPPEDGMRTWTTLQQPDLTGPPLPDSITPVFSPRKTVGMLEWYAEQMGAAKRSVFFTAAFSVADQIMEKATRLAATENGEPYLRYLLLESATGMMRKKYTALAACPQNRIAWGDLRRRPDEEAEDHREFIETLTGLNGHVEYLHTKYLLVDPLSDDPVVITGSANFSKNSTTDNDENMLIIRGDTRVADIFLCEFMRLFNHFHRRNERNAAGGQAKPLAEDDSWTIPYFTPGEQENAERLLFA